MMTPYAPCRRLACRALLFLWLAPAAVALAGGEPYGRDFAREGARWGEGGPPAVLVPPLPAAADAPPAAELAALRARLAALEAEGGPYAGGLEEPLAALGRALAARGRYAEAVAAYRRALHVLRVNDGLYGEAQKPLLAALLGIYRAAGDFATLDEQYPWFYRVYGNGQPPLTGLRLEAALAYQRWQREALRRDLGNGTRRLLALIDEGAELLDRVAGEPAAAWRARRDLALSQLRNLYLVGDLVAPPPEDYPGLRDPDPFQRNELFTDDPQEERLQALRRTAQGDGRRLLEELAAAAPDPEARAEVLVALGDWQQWHGREGAAREAWENAIDALKRAGRRERVAALFGEPRELPDNGVFWQPPTPAADAPRPVVAARFTVTERGRARAVDAETVSGRDSARIGVVRSLRRLRFRPAFADGAPVATAGVERFYEVYD
ncbi:MAG: hypothetical protein ACX93N_09210 [Pseudohaliea sp.]